VTDISNDNQQQQTQNASFRRCYCNLPSCVKTGYMCKSMTGACFAQLSLDGAASDGGGHAHVRYACAEFLPSETDRQACHVTAGDAGRVTLRRRGLPTTAPSETESEQWAETVCCATDMCNYYYFRSTSSVQLQEVDGETSALGLLMY
jgi:BMP and activin membrane-bound inhibitor (BAMBI) N-terminal domain